MKIKVCGNVCNITEVAREVQPDMMGFIFHPSSPRNAFLVTADDLRCVPPHISRVGVFVNRPSDEIDLICRTLGIDTLQLHGKETPAQCRELKEKGYTVFKALGVNATLDFSSLKDYGVDMFVFDTPTPAYGGSGLKFNWQLLDKYTLSTPFLLSGGLGLSDIDALKSLEHPALAGFDINSKFEHKPGHKNITLLKKFINEIR